MSESHTRRLDSDDAEVRRFDLSRFSPKTTRTPQGFLRAPATFTRAGVFEYRRADGTTVRELRPADEVFATDSMASVAGAPVVIDHPAEGWVSAANARRLAVGWGSEKVERQDTHLAGALTIHDQPAIDRVGKDLVEISMGYACRIDRTPGTDPDFGPYDQVQRSIKYNHIALGPSGWGRAGPTVGLRLDAGDAYQADPTLTENTNSPDTGKDQNNGAERARVDTMKVTINGITFDLDEKAAQALSQDQARHDSLVKEHEQLKGRHDAAADKVKELEKKVAEAEDPKRFDSAVAERVALIDSARKVLGQDAKIAGTAREIMEQALKHDRKDPPSFEGKSDDYVTSRFDALIEDLPAKKAEESKRQTRRDAVDAQGDKSRKSTDTVDRYDSKAARERMLKEHADAASQPLT